VSGVPRWAIALSATIIGLGLVVGYSDFWPAASDEERIYEMVADMQRAAERGDYLSVLRYVADDYHDAASYTRQDLRRLAIQADRDAAASRVTSRVKGLVLSGKKATMQVDVLVWESSGAEEQKYSVRATLEKRGRRWVIVSSEGWQDAIGTKLGGE
jgi:hypothetical protein